MPQIYPISWKHQISVKGFSPGLTIAPKAVLMGNWVRCMQGEMGLHQACLYMGLDGGEAESRGVPKSVLQRPHILHALQSRCRLPTGHVCLGHQAQRLRGAF